MNCEATRFFFKSSNGVNNIACYNYNPAVKPRAVVQVTHGMNESIERYGHFANFLTERGFAVIGHDHLGHGNSVEDEEDFGYFAANDGYKRLVEDMRTVTLKASELYPGAPIIIFAHSMGTFVARLYMTSYAGENIYPCAFILCGTSGPVRAVTFGIAEAKRIAAKNGDRYRSKTLNNAIRKDYNKKLPVNVSVYNWLTRDEKVVEKYLNDDKSRFIFTASAFADMFTMLKLVSAQEWYSSVPKELPVYLIAGEVDPVGQFGRGVTKVYNALKNAGVKNVKLDLYPECRHELINELNKDEIFEDIYNFMTGALGLETV